MTSDDGESDGDRSASPTAPSAAPTDRDFMSIRNLQFPVSRIKKIMKSDEDVAMISGEVPILFSKACELFIQDVTRKAYEHTRRCKRRTLNKSDIAAAVASCSLFDFLVDIVPQTAADRENELATSGEPRMAYQAAGPIPLDCNGARQTLPPPFAE